MFGKSLRILAIVLMGFSAAMMVLGGIGTICIAFWPEKYPTLSMMVPYKPIYQVAAITTIVAGLFAVRATMRLRRFQARHVRAAIIILLVSLATAGVKMYFSSKVRGSVAPTNIRFYLSLLTMVYLLILRWPGVWQRVRTESPDDQSGQIGTGIAAIVAGIPTLTVQFWAASTHVLQGVNYADVWHWQLAVVGWSLIAGGVWLLLRCWSKEARFNLAGDSDLQSPPLPF